MKEKYVCCICGKEFIGWGNNPTGAAWKDENGKIVMPEFKEDDYCCDECNGRFVIPGRLCLYSLNKK